MWVDHAINVIALTSYNEAGACGLGRLGSGIRTYSSPKRPSKERLRLRLRLMSMSMSIRWAVWSTTTDPYPAQRASTAQQHSPAGGIERHAKLRAKVSGAIPCTLSIQRTSNNLPLAGSKCYEKQPSVLSHFLDRPRLVYLNRV